MLIYVQAGRQLWISENYYKCVNRGKFGHWKIDGRKQGKCMRLVQRSAGFANDIRQWNIFTNWGRQNKKDQGIRKAYLILGKPKLIGSVIFPNRLGNVLGK